MEKKLYIKEDITDWRDEALQKEIVVTCEQDIFDLIDAGEHTAGIARATVVGQETGAVDENILRPNKALINVGAMLDISQKVVAKKRYVLTPSGNKFSGRIYIGQTKVKDDESDEDQAQPKSYILVRSKDGLKYIENYLFKIVPGHIWNRLLNIVDAGGDVEFYADELKKKIDDMVTKILVENGN